MASIEKRSDNSYRITVSVGYDVQGKKIRKKKTVILDTDLAPKKLEKELQRQATLFEDEVKKGIYLDGSKMTFAEFIEKWLHDYAEKQLAPKTLQGYKGLLERIIPVLGHKKLDKLRPNHLLEFYNNLGEIGLRQDNKYIALPTLVLKITDSGIKPRELAEKAGISINTLRAVLDGEGTTKAMEISKALDVKLKTVFKLKGEPQPLSSNTINHYHRLISSILTSAVQWQVIFSNPAERVKSPRIEKKEAAHYDEDLTERMLILLENEPIKYRLMVSLTVFAGVRRGELCGIEWPDVDLDNGHLRIRQASQYIPGQGTFTKDPKNDSSVRVISLPGIAVSMLEEYKIWQDNKIADCGDQWVEEWNDQQRLFTQWNGKPIFPDTISGWFKKFREKYDLPELCFHGLRHTNASILIGNGVDLSTVSKRLGHARTSTTSDIYAHALRRPDKEAAEKLDNLFGKDEKPPKLKIVPN